MIDIFHFSFRDWIHPSLKPTLAGGLVAPPNPPVTVKTMLEAWGPGPSNFFQFPSLSFNPPQSPAISIQFPVNFLQYPTNVLQSPINYWPGCFLFCAGRGRSASLFPGSVSHVRVNVLTAPARACRPAHALGRRVWCSRPYI